MLKRADKEKIVKKIEKRIEKSKSIFFAAYKGTGVADLSAVRRDLREGGDKLTVFKNRLLKIALKNKKIKIPAKFFRGQLITLFAKSDELTSLKILHKFYKQKERLEPKGGIFESKFIDKEKIEALAKIPGREELYAKLVGTVNAPISGLVNVLAGNIRNLIGVLNNIKESK